MIAASAHAADPVNIQIMAVEEQPGQMTLTVSAVDEKGKPFPGLGASSFNAWIDDQPLIIRGLQTETSRLPASILLLVDVSGSMAGEPMNQAKAAIQQFIDGLEGQDQVAVMSFSSNVHLLQDFTADHNALAHAVSQLTPVGETALYDGVIQAAQKMASAPAGRKLVVLLSDGTATIGVNNRGASIQNAQASGVGVVAFGLGTGIDRRYLNELSTASGGRFLEAANPAALKQAYADLASAIRSQYTLQVEVPRSIDRTVPGRLKVHVIYRADNAFAERGLEALEGAIPPPFTMALEGLKPGDKPTGLVSLAPKVQEGIEVVKLDYYLDDNVIHTTDGSAAAFDLDASLLGSGSHVLKIVATDAAGREGEVQVPFIVPVVAASGGGASVPLLPLALLAALAIALYLGHKYFWKRIVDVVRGGDVYETRVSSWASIRTPGPVQRPEEWPERPEPMTAPMGTAEDALRGRVVIMDEEAVRNGELESIREFEMRSSPLTFGSGPGVDMRVGDAGGLIAAEEARVWVQRGRLVYHKLTTLSAMATEGVTAGWQFLEDGDEMRIGPYRLIFQAQIEEEVEVEAMPTPDRLPQEHGMALRPTGTDDAGNRGFSSWVSDTRSPSVEESRSPSLHDFNTSGQDDSVRTWNTNVAEPAAPSWEDTEETASEWTGGASESAESEWAGEEEARPVGTEETDNTDEAEAVRWGASEETLVSQWGVVSGEAATEVEPEDEGSARESSAWTFAEQSAATEWTSEPVQDSSYDWNGNGHVEGAQWADSELEDDAGVEGAPEGEPLQPEAWSTFTAGGSEEGPSWKAGEWDLDEEEDEDQKYWGT
jgi:VWFA-related protein